ncbi:MAG: beta-lactamase family protein, partial [Defluviitaleaceae bacterium]|nr:beta-lactamase family protein [Defluviitaleaceae bacterium]
SFNDVAFLFGDAGDFSETIATAVSTSLQLMEALSVPGLTIALVDAETGFTFTQGLGFADSVNRVFADEHTLFQVGSTSKPFTAIAVMQLVEQGIIDLDEPLVTYLPEFSLLPSYILGGNSDNITVRMLLSNTSGIISNFVRGFLTIGNEHYQGHMNSILEWLPEREMTFEEGTMYEYANNNWTILGVLVARMMGHDNYFEGFVEYTNENIFAPLGMDRTTFEFTNNLTNVAMPYIATGTQVPMHLMPPISTGGLMSTAHDMARFMHTILGDGTLDGHELLPQETIRYMMQDHTSHVAMAPPVVGYGLGFLHMLVNDLQTVGHGGNIIHYHTEMIFDVENGLGVFISTNSLTGISIATATAFAVLQSAITEKTGTAPVAATEPVADIGDATPIELSLEELEELLFFEGLYSFGLGGLWHFKIVDGVPSWISLSGDMVIELTPMSDGTFVGITGSYTFVYMDGHAISMLGELPGVRIDDIESLRAPEGFEAWVGTYTFSPQIANETFTISQLIISINDMGMAMLAVANHLGASEVPIGQVGERWFLALDPIEFILNEDGTRTIDLMGGHFVRQ